MGLSTPLALVASLLVALPIIAHLVRRADVQRRVLPTVALLRRALVQDRARARLTEPWLLALRVLAILAAVLALSGPFLVEQLAYGDGTALSIVLVLDDSASMAQRVSGSGSALDAARARARAIVDSLPEGSEISVVLAGAPARLAAPRSIDREGARAALDAARVGARRTDVEGALALGARQLAGARFTTRRVVVLSDFSFDGELAARLPGGVEVEPIAVVPESGRDNAGILDARSTPDLLERGAFSITVDVASYAETPPTELTLGVLALAPGAGRVTSDAVELTRASVPLVDGRGRASLRFSPPGGGTRVALRLLDADDASPLDDERVLDLREPRPTRVVVIEPSGRRTGSFLTRALAALPEDVGAFLVSAVDVDSLSRLPSGSVDPNAAEPASPLASADVLVLAGVAPTTPTGVEAVRAFVEGGGGLLVAASESLRASDLQPLQGLLPARVREVGPAPTRPDEGPSVRAAHTSAFLPEGNAGLEGTRIESRLALDADDADVVLRASDDAPLLVLDEASRRAILAVGLDDAMSDLPLRVGFLPLVASLTRALSRPGVLPDRPFVAGEVPALRVDGDVSRVEILTPDGALLRRSAEAGSVPLDDLSVPGAYAIQAEVDGRLRELDGARLTLVVPAEELDLRPRVPASRAHMGDVARESEARRPIARWFFLLLGVLALIEGFARHRRELARLSAKPPQATHS